MIADLLRAVSNQNFVAANKAFTSIIADKMREVLVREYKDVAKKFVSKDDDTQTDEQAPPHQGSYVEEVIDEPSSSSNMEQFDMPGMRGPMVRDIVREKKRRSPR